MVNDYYEKTYPNGPAKGFWQRFIVPQIKRIKGYKCEECGSTKNLDVHHTRKDLININTVRLLCKKCHKAEHVKQVKIQENIQKNGRKQYRMVIPSKIIKLKGWSKGQSLVFAMQMNGDIVLKEIS